MDVVPFHSTEAFFFDRGPELSEGAVHDGAVVAQLVGALDRLQFGVDALESWGKLLKSNS